MPDSREDEYIMKKPKTYLKIIAVILLLCSVLPMLCPMISITDTYQSDMTTIFDKVQDTIDVVGNVDEQLSSLISGYDLNLSEYEDALNQDVEVLSDGKMMLWEIPTAFECSAKLGYGMLTLTSKTSDIVGLFTGDSQESKVNQKFDEVEKNLTTAIDYMGTLRTVYYAALAVTLLSVIITIILHLCNTRICGFFSTLCYVFWAGFIYMEVQKVNELLQKVDLEFFQQGNMLAASIFPFISVFFALVSCIVWVFYLKSRKHMTNRF
jgi:hypothetical protein